MKKYTILIEELVSNSFEIEASSEEEARKIAEAGYRNGEIVLDRGIFYLSAWQSFHIAIRVING